MTLEATRVAVAQSSKCSAESNLSISEEVELSNQRKGTEHSKAVQAKRHAQKQSRSIIKSDDESVEDSKPAATTAFDVTVNYGDDKHENLQDALKISTVVESHLQDHPRNELSPLPWCIDRVGDTETSNTTIPIAALKMALTESATLAAAVCLSHAKPPPNQVLGSVNEIVQPQDEELLSEDVLVESNDMSTL